MLEGYSKWIDDNPEEFKEKQRKAGKAAAVKNRLKLQKLKYNNEIYYGWNELVRATNKSKWFLKKEGKVIIL